MTSMAGPTARTEIIIIIMCEYEFAKPGIIKLNRSNAI